MNVKCIGRGSLGEGCGYTEGKSGQTCPNCGGMLLSEAALSLADEMVKRWEVGPPWICELVKPTDPVLWNVAAPVTDIEAQVRPYIRDMDRLMRKKNGVGLAAPQVGLPFRFFITKIPAHSIVINPSLTMTSGDRSSQSEGCLTWPGRTLVVSRPRTVSTTWTDYHGRERSSTLQGFNARIFQHELDHLNGICLFSK